MEGFQGGSAALRRGQICVPEGGPCPGPTARCCVAGCGAFVLFEFFLLSSQVQMREEEGIFAVMGCAKEDGLA